MSQINKGILFINLGTPESASVKDVRRFLREFLMDPLVVDLPFVTRFLLVNLLIVPFRGPKSAAEYKMLWSEKGSPLKAHSLELVNKLQAELEDKYHISLAMRYQTPSIRSGLEELRSKGCEELLILPLFPQYAEATTQSVLNKVDDEVALMNWQVERQNIDSFATNEQYIKAVAAQADLTLNNSEAKNFDYTLFSYHGLPERQLKKLYGHCLTDSCCEQLTQENQNCYRAQCFATTRALVKQLNLSKSEYGICFQSRQGKIPWIQPYIEDEIQRLAAEGKQKLRVFSPAFVADCLETTIEIAHTYKNLFQELGGETLTLVPSLNSSSVWVEALKSIIEEKNS